MSENTDDYQRRVQMVANTIASERRIAMQRTSYAYGGGFNDTLGTKRSKVWQDFGYPNALNFWSFLNLYQRHSLAHAIIHRITEKSWEDDPWIVEGDETDNDKAETRWERDLRTLFKRLNLWQKFQDADRRRLVGMYSGLILQVADDRQWHEELEPGELVGVIPAWQGQLTPVEWDNNPASVTYGRPTMWQYQEAEVETADYPPPGRSVTIHHSRVVVVGDYREGVPLLEAAYNDFVSLEKVLGALGESYWKNAARQISMEYAPETRPQDLAEAAGVKVEDLHDALNGMFADLNQGLDAGMVNFGGKATPLVANVPDPKEPFNVLAQSICSSAMIPMKIAVGNQTGERASTEDQDDFNKRCQSRRTGELMTDVRRLIDRLMEYGIIDTVGEYQVMWTDLTEAGLADKLGNVEVMAKINQAMQLLGGVYTHDEMRAMTGHDPLPDGDEVGAFGEGEDE